MVRKPKIIHPAPGDDVLTRGFDTARAIGSFLDYRLTFPKKDVIVAGLRPVARDDATTLTVIAA